MLPSNHPLAGQSEVALAKFANESFISLANNAEYSRFTTSLCERAGFMPIKNYEVDSTLLAEIIQLEQGVALLPISVCRKFNLHFVKIANMNPTYTVGLSWVKIPFRQLPFNSYGTLLLLTLTKIMSTTKFNTFETGS